MPRDASGIYTLAAGNPVVTGTTIDSSWANATLPDIATAMTDSLSRTGNGGMQAPLVATVGAVGAPSLTFSGGSTSGWWWDAASGEMRASIATAQVLQVQAAGITVTGDIVGDLTGNVTGNADTATLATNATNTRSFGNQESNIVNGNVGDGNGALGSLTTGGNNTAIGDDALHSLTDGDFNTAIGRQAGRDATGDNCVFIGYGAGYSESGSDKLVISGDGLFGGKLIYGDFSAQTLTIYGTLTSESNEMTLSYQAASGAGPHFHFEKRGAIGDATGAIGSGQSLGGPQWYGWDGSGQEQGASIQVNATENWSGAGQGARMSFNVVQNTGTATVTRMVINEDGNVNIGADTSPAYKLNVNGTLNSAGAASFASINVPTSTPASASATGTTGDIAWDADYIYVCTATDTWKRTAIATW